MARATDSKDSKDDINYKQYYFMTISNYHQKYIDQSNGEIQKKINEKRAELIAIFSAVQLKTSESPTRVAVLGCGDKRFVKAHKKLFEEFVNSAVELITFDVTIDHLSGEDGVFQHDCTLVLPMAPFALTYAHVVLRFIETEKQWDLIINSYNALQKGGLAIHVLDREDYETKDSLLANGLYSVPLDRWKERLDDLKIYYLEVPIKYGLALVLVKE